MKTAAILVNLGTPAALNTKAIRRFLREFLSDPRVIQDIPPWVWKIILEGFILPLRPGRIVQAYQKVWLKEGSPLMVISQAQVAAVQKILEKSDPDISVFSAMSYGQPSLEKVLQDPQVQNAERLIVLPLYPQYSSSTTAPVFDGLARIFKKQMHIPELIFINQYHLHPLYIKALSQSIHDHWQSQGRSDLLLFSFHGIPVSYCERGDPYARACAETVEAVAKALNLSEKDYALSFQSRLGRQVWLQPYTLDFVQACAQRGIRSLDVIAPGFSVDCLETLEELDMQNREAFMAAGGEKFSYIPALNDQSAHIELLAELIRAAD